MENYKSLVYNSNDKKHTKKRKSSKEICYSLDNENNNHSDNY